MPACGSSGDDDPVTQATPPPDFTFEMSDEVNFDLSVTIDSAPAQGVSVQLTHVRTAPNGDEVFEDELNGELFFNGVTDALGTISETLTIPLETEQVDIVVHRTGTTGPYTDANLQTFLGPVAPSARVTVNRADLAAQVIDLTTTL